MNIDYTSALQPARLSHPPAAVSCCKAVPWSSTAVLSRMSTKSSCYSLGVCLVTSHKWLCSTLDNGLCWRGRWSRNWETSRCRRECRCCATNWRLTGDCLSVIHTQTRTDSLYSFRHKLKTRLFSSYFTDWLSVFIYFTNCCDEFPVRCRVGRA